MDKLPKEWKLVPFGKYTSISRGYNPPKSEFIYEPRVGYTRFIQIRDGSSDAYTVYVPDSPKLHLASKEDLLLVAYRHVGKVFRGMEGAFNVALCKIVINNREVLNVDFLFYMISTDLVKGELLKRSERALIPSMSVDHLKSLQIPLPPLSEQTRIVSTLDALFARIDQSIALLEENIKHTKGLMASVLEELFVNGKNWKREPLNKVAKVERGKSKHRPRNDQKLFGDSYPFIQTGDVRSANKYIDKYEVCYSEFGLKQSRLWNKGTICLTIAANIGDVAILGFEACFPDSVVGITPYSMNNEFLYYYLKTLQLQLDKKANSAAQKNINLKILSEIDVPVPSIEIQNSIADRFSRLEEKQFQILSVQQSKLNYLKALKSSLLDRAFKGDL